MGHIQKLVRISIIFVLESPKFVIFKHFSEASFYNHVFFKIKLLRVYCSLRVLVCQLILRI